MSSLTWSNYGKKLGWLSKISVCDNETKDQNRDGKTENAPD